MSAPLASNDPELEAALKEVLQVIYKSCPLKANQILALSSELQRIGVHKLVEEHLERCGPVPAMLSAPRNGGTDEFFQGFS